MYEDLSLRVDLPALVVLVVLVPAGEAEVVSVDQEIFSLGLGESFVASGRQRGIRGAKKKERVVVGSARFGREAKVGHIYGKAST